MFKKIRDLMKNDIVLVYQMGKVGSTGIVNAIRRCGLNCLVVHGFYRHPVETIFSAYKSTEFYRPLQQRLKYRFKLYFLRVLLMKNKKLKIVSIVREPISRNMSFFFQDIQIPIMDLHIEKDTVDSKEISIYGLIESFFLKYGHSQGVDWFDDEFRKSTGIDIYTHEFDKCKGFVRFHSGDIEVLVARMENLSELENEISDFLGLQELRLPRENTGSDKWYSSIYEEFKNKIQFEENYIDRLYGSRFMKYFYSDKEIDGFRKHYLKK